MRVRPCSECGTPCQGSRCAACFRASRRLPDSYCEHCGVKVHPQSTRCNPCAQARRRAPREKGNGYLREFIPGHPLAGADGYVLMHRRVAHDAGLVVPAGYHVHHRNGDKTDNRIENLEVIAASAHSQLHADARTEVRNQFGVWPCKAGLVAVDDALAMRGMSE